MPKYQYKIRNKVTKKYWSSNTKASWLQEGAATDQLKRAATNWGMSNTEMVRIPLEETPGIPYQEWIDQMTMKNWSEDLIIKKLNYVIREQYARHKDSQTTVISDRILKHLRSIYNIPSSRIDVTETEFGVHVYASVSIRIAQNQDRSYVTTQDIHDATRQTRIAANKLAAETSRKAQEEQEYQLFLKLNKKFGPNLFKQE